ncbi:hypothetical protein [Colwellia psychrerythraea]|uniref:Uncharacterized protein n=1 Tax=Colwellia psychrerythraea TaxID=28229 RepID=A0A099KY42_COLPS|nr:hypothetical protein [Colwellia psychrerythraea]KGJ94807.1 hypothetical protein GAB14E_2041 [Colwellia psychrerythraea]
MNDVTVRQPLRWLNRYVAEGANGVSAVGIDSVIVANQMIRIIKERNIL